MIAYDRLKQIIPADQALANKALQVSLQQIKNVAQMTLPALASTFSFTSTTKDLNLINELTEPVPPSVQDYYANTYATGSGPDGTLLLTDLIGASAGAGYTDPINNCVTIINSLTSDGTLGNLIITYSRMANTVDGTYGDPVTGPVIIPAGIGNGTYANADEAITTLISNAQTAITDVVLANSTATDSLNTEFTDIAVKLISENTNLTKASLVISTLIPNNRSAINSFVEQLPSFGPNIVIDGPAWYLEQVADLTTLGGQAVVGCLRQGRNTFVMQSTGVGYDTDVSSIPTTDIPEANLIPSTYTSSEISGSGN